MYLSVKAKQPKEISPMRIQVRDKVFETNSSSSHSVTVADDEVRDIELDKETLRKGVIELDLGRYYGWEWERFYKPENKLAYLLTQAIRYDVSDIDLGDVTARYREDNFDFDNIIKEVESFTGCKVKVNISGEVGVDHDSAGVGLELARDGKKLIDFLFSSKSFVELGNDNSGPSEYMDSDIGKVHSFSQNFKEAPKRGQVFTLELSDWGQEVVLITKDKSQYYGVANHDASSEIADSLKDVGITKAYVDIHFGLKNTWDRDYARDKQAAAKTDLHEIVASMRSNGGDIFIDPEFKFLFRSHDHHDKSSYDVPRSTFKLECKAPKKTVDALIDHILLMQNELRKSRY